MRVVVAGAGVTGYQVIKMLVANKHDVVVIDKDRETCETVYTETGAVIIHGSATDIRILEKAGVRNSDAIACLLRDDGDNIAAAILAKSLKVPSIIAVLRIQSLRSHLKNRILVLSQGGTEFHPTDTLKYFEELKRGPNTEIGPKDFFVTASSLSPDVESIPFFSALPIASPLGKDYHKYLRK